jgi:hypothetical protein
LMLRNSQAKRRLCSTAVLLSDLLRHQQRKLMARMNRKVILRDQNLPLNLGQAAKKKMD